MLHSMRELRSWLLCSACHSGPQVTCKFPAHSLIPAHRTELKENRDPQLEMRKTAETICHACYKSRIYRVKKNIWVTWCRIDIPASPPGMYPAVEFQDGDLRTKSLMVIRRRRDLDRFGPQCA